MTIRTSPALPADHGRHITDHYARARLMRHTDKWVHVGNYATRSAAQNTAYQIRSGLRPAYTSGHYDAQAITTSDGTHQVWGRYQGGRNR